MKTTNIIIVLLLIFGMNISAKNLKSSDSKNASQLSQQERINVNLDLKNLKQVAEVDPRYQSFNIEMCEVVGGKFWIPYEIQDTIKGKKKGGFDALKRKMSPIDLSGKKIKMLTSALGPIYIRVSGTWANTTYFQNNDEPALTTAPAGYENVLTRYQWKGVVDFCNTVNAKLVTSFAISAGIRDKDGNWTPAQAEPLINYTKSIGGDIAAAEMFNEPSHASYGGAPKKYDPAYFARDFDVFKRFMKNASPETKIVGPGNTGEGGILPTEEEMSTDKLFLETSKPDFDIFSYHYYGGVSKRCFGNLTPEYALSKEWLSKTELGLRFYEEVRDKYQPGKQIWLTETAEAACGGNRWAATYVDCFRYLEQMGRLAKKNVKVIMHNTLAASEYAILDSKTHDPRPNYWAALLWNKLMGTKVYEAGINNEGVDVFVHNLKGAKDGFAVLVINPTESAYALSLPVSAEKYLFTADGENLQTKAVKLNGKILELSSKNTMPSIKGKKVKAGELSMPAHSIMFLSIKKAK
jgi:heparanase 1